MPNGAADVAERLVGSQARSGARFGDACSHLRAQTNNTRALALTRPLLSCNAVVRSVRCGGLRPARGRLLPLSELRRRAAWRERKACCETDEGAWSAALNAYVPAMRPDVSRAWALRCVP